MPIDPKDVQWDATPAIDASQVKWDTPAQPTQAAPQEEKALGPWASAVVRPIAEGVGALPMLAADVGVATRNLTEQGVRKYLPKAAAMVDKVTGGGPGEPYELPSKMYREALDSLTTAPQGAIGKGAEFISSALAGGVGGAPQAAIQAPEGFVRALPKAAAATGADEFLGRGIPLTMGQRGGKALKAIEDFAANVPIVGPAIRARQQEALEAWNKDLLQQISDKVTKGGKEGFEQAGTALSNAYKTIWKAELPFNRAGLRDQWSALAGQISQKLPKEQAQQIVATLQHQFKQVLSGARQEGTQGATLESVDDALREAAKKAARAGDGAVAGVYNQARSAFRDQFDPAVNAALKQTDELYMRLSTLRNAAKRSGWETFTPAQLLMAAKRKAGDAAVAEMRAPFQQEALNAADVLGTARSGAQAALERGVGKVVGTGALVGGSIADMGTTALAATLGRLAYSKTGQKILTSLPKSTRKAVEEVAKRPRALNSTLTQMEQD